MKEMHESELQQVRALCERRLHAEVEQAKHDIARALEEEIQVLLVACSFHFMFVI
jgi:glucose-6-phosphate-specific signal transduction histidine kinase